MGPSPQPRSYLRWKSLQNASCRRIAFRITLSRTEAVRAQSGCALGPRQQVTEHRTEETIMAWTTPTLVEICIGLEINGYLPAEF